MPDLFIAAMLWRRLCRFLIVGVLLSRCISLSLWVGRWVGGGLLACLSLCRCVRPGQVFCHKCCKTKIKIPELGYKEEVTGASLLTHPVTVTVCQEQCTGSAKRLRLFV